MYGGFTLLDAKIKNAKDGVSEGKTVIGEPKLPALMSKIFPKIKSNNNKSGMLSSRVETIIVSKNTSCFWASWYDV